jgi:chemotaxis response regulator CheB
MSEVVREIDVLVIDDSEFTQMVTTQILTRDNLTCNSAFNGAEGVDIILSCE